MPESNPYVPPSTASDSRFWRPIDLLVVGIWLVIPGGLFVGQNLLPPVFAEFEVELPATTQYLLTWHATATLASVSLGVLLAVFMLPFGRMRRRFLQLACVLGMLVGVICLLSMLWPLLSLWLDLSG